MKTSNTVRGMFAMMLLAACAGRTNAPAVGARADFADADGNAIGNAALLEESGGVRIRVTVNSLPPGEHGIHIHAVGKCEPPFTSAGGHFNPLAKKHGTLNPEGPHAGDLPNLSVSAGGSASADVLAGGVALESLFDADGSALVIHAGPDDYKTDPTGNSGARVACAVIRRP
jgi:Cu-Zn family superoxide dismutase